MNLRNLFQSTVPTSPIMHFTKAAVLALLSFMPPCLEEFLSSKND